MADDPAPFESYQSFLKTSMQRYWDRKGSSKVTFLALMLATRQAWGVAASKGLSLESGKKALTGAAGLAAGAMLIRIFLGGPLGLLLAGASAISLIAVYGKNQEAIWKKVLRFRGLIDDYEGHYTHVSPQKATEMQRELLLEGLMRRLLAALDTIPEDEEEDELIEEVSEEEARSFAAHIAKKTEVLEEE